MDNVFVKDAIKTQQDLQNDKQISDELVKKFDEVENKLMNLQDMKIKRFFR